MITAVLFDMGGTLDGEGHWLDRFVALYAACGVPLPRERIRAAFDEAEGRAATDPAIASAGLDAMIAQHIAWQFAALGLADATLASALVAGFVAPIRAAAAENRRLLAALASRGLALGVVSNGCGNVEALCREYGYAPYLQTIVDSRRAGVSKPDPAIFSLAVQQLGRRPAETIVVGDSFDRDIVPAKRAGMLTAWLAPAAQTPADPSVVDVRLVALSELPTYLLQPARTA